MTQDQPSFELERFELIPATPLHALLRVRGRWTVPRGSHPAPALLATDGGQHRFAALDVRAAAIAGRGEEWSAAYAAPVAVLEATETTFWLDGPGGRISLPAPVEAPPGESRLRERRVTPDRRREDGKGVSVREERRSGVDRRRQRSYAELRAFRLDIARLEARLEDLTDRAEAAEAGAAAATKRIHKLEAALADRVGYVHALEARATEAEDAVALREQAEAEGAAAREEVAQLQGRLREGEAALREAQAQAQAARTASASSRRDTARLFELASIAEDQAEMLDLAEAAAVAARAELEQLRNQAG